MGALARKGDTGALSSLRRTIRNRPKTADERWGAAAHILSQVDLAGIWATIWSTISSTTSCANKVFDKLACVEFMGRWPEAICSLAPSELGSLYDLMLEQTPPTNDPAILTTVLENRHRLRDYLPLIIAEYRTPDATRELRRIANKHQHIPQLRQLVWSHGRQVAEVGHCALRLDEFTILVDDPARRVVQDVRQLRDVVLESCARLQDALTGENRLATLLWNRDNSRGTTGWWPAWEEDLSDLVAWFLKLDLADRGTIVNREVQFERTGLGGERTDILVQAYPTGRQDNIDLLTVVIECKGCWNDGLNTDLRSQLIDRYLAHPGKIAGIFLVGYFDCSHWKNQRNDRNDRPHSKHSITTVRQQQDQAVARATTETGRSIAAMVLDCRLSTNKRK